MNEHTVGYKGDNTNRRLSPRIWSDCPINGLMSGTRDGFFYFNDFHTLNTTDDWTLTQVNNGTALLIDGLGGLLELDTASTTNDDGIELQHLAEYCLPAAGDKIWFECRLYVTDTPSTLQLFMGLAVEDTTVFNAGENSTANHVGFEMGAALQAGASAGIAQLYGEKAGTRGTISDVHTFVDGTHVKLGFAIDGITSITGYANGTANGTTLDVDSIPVTEMTLTMVAKSEGGGSTDPIAVVDWVALAQVE